MSENVADVAGGDRHFPKTDMRHGFAANGDPKTWTGKIIPLDAWPNLTEWDRHGPNGRLYCGVCQQCVARHSHLDCRAAAMGGRVPTHREMRVACLFHNGGNFLAQKSMDFIGFSELYKRHKDHIP